MRMGAGTIAVCAIACFHASPGAAQRTLTLAEVLARAREQAPQIVSARLAMEETRGRLLGASRPVSRRTRRSSGCVGNRQRDRPSASPTSSSASARRSSRAHGGRRASLAPMPRSRRAPPHVDEVTRTVLRQAASAYLPRAARERTHPPAERRARTGGERVCGGRSAVQGGRHRGARREHRARLAGPRQRRTRRRRRPRRRWRLASCGSCCARDRHQRRRDRCRRRRTARCRRGACRRPLSARSCARSKLASRKRKPTCGSA